MANFIHVKMTYFVRLAANLKKWNLKNGMAPQTEKLSPKNEFQYKKVLAYLQKNGIEKVPFFSF